MTPLGVPVWWDRLNTEPQKLAAEVCLVDVSKLDETLQGHPALRAWVNAVHEGARIEEEQAKWQVTKSYALAFLRAKTTPDPDTGKGKNVDTLKAEAESDPEHVAAQEALFVIQRKRGALRAMADALEDRKDMLIQIAAKRRKEQEDYHG